MVLTILERLMILQALPKEGNILLLRLRQGLISKVGLSAEDYVKFEVKQTPEGKVTWKSDIPQEVEIDLNEAEMGIIKSSLKDLDRAGKLLPDQLSLWEKFVE